MKHFISLFKRFWCMCSRGTLSSKTKLDKLKAFKELENKSPQWGGIIPLIAVTSELYLSQ